MQDYAAITAVASAMTRQLDPCAATSSMFLYAQGSSIVCSHHDTLTIEKRFSRHSDEVQLLAVDNQSEKGAGRLVVSYDASHTAIVWELEGGTEMTRFASFTHLTCASWMKNGNIVFGNAQGAIILFEPSSSEHLSTRTIDQIAVTAIAPSSDCRTFAIGYQNGSLLIATLQPRFTILHNLSTSRAPSPIANLAWHASSSRQKSDMLAVQTNDGDLRVWSVSKSYKAEDPAKVVRILKRTENSLPGPNWMGWSKNGRVIQFSEETTLSWDVRTKHVTYDTVPTLAKVRGLAVYGPGASLFTLGANNTVQQFDLNAPAMMVANVQHPANLLPPSPPMSLEEQDRGSHGAWTTESESVAVMMHRSLSESEEEQHCSPLARLVRGEPKAEPKPYQPASPVSSRSRSNLSLSSTSTTSSRPYGYAASAVSQCVTEKTYISTGSSLPPGSRQARLDQHRRLQKESFSTASRSHEQARSRSRPSRLRNEMPRNCEDTRAQDLFPFTRSRLVDVPYRQEVYRGPEGGRLTNHDLRRQMLSLVFGWHQDAEGLVRDEMARHPLGSTNRILLAKWVGDVSANVLANSSHNMTSSDWMLLALSGIGGEQAATSQQHKLGRMYVQRLLETGDVHAAATIMIGLGDQNDAVEIYVSHRKYLEALLLACIFFPAVWERQAQILRQWGTWAVQHGQQQLAIRCFACTGKESTEPWTSPSAAQISFPNLGASLPERLSPSQSQSPPQVANVGPQRSLAKTSALKLITSFGDPHAKAKFFEGSPADGGKTPIAGGVTPIAESAVSPGGPYGGGTDLMTAMLHGNRSALHTPSSARPTHARQLLPSIGEAPDQLLSRGKMAATGVSPGPAPSSTDSHLGSSDDAAATIKQAAQSQIQRQPMQLEAIGATAAATNADTGVASTESSPIQACLTERPRDAPPPSPSPQSIAALMEASKRERNGSRSRIPEGVDMHLPVLNDAFSTGDVASPDQSVASSSRSRYHWPVRRRRGPGSGASSVTSSASNTRGKQHLGRHHPIGNALHDCIHSLEAAQSRSLRGSSRDRGYADRPANQSKRARSREESRERGRPCISRTSKTAKGPKRSPTSPVPMSPEDLLNLAPSGGGGDTTESAVDDAVTFSIDKPNRDPTGGFQLARMPTPDTGSSSRAESREGRRPARNGSPEGRQPAPLTARSRSNTRGGKEGLLQVRLSSSPTLMSAAGGSLHGHRSDDEEDLRSAIEAKDHFRRRNDPSASRGRCELVRNEHRLTQHHVRGDGGSDQMKPVSTPAPMQQVDDSSGGDLRILIKDDRQLKKEAAARELEERRKSLARRALTPAIPHPDELSPSPPTRVVSAMGDRAGTARYLTQAPELSHRRLAGTLYSAAKKVVPPVRSASTEPSSQRTTHSNRPIIGLPATPKAMRLMMSSEVPGKHKPLEPLPPVPTTFAQATSPAYPSGPKRGSNHNSPIRNSPPKTVVEVAASLVSDAIQSPKILLPSTVYTPPPPSATPNIARSVSAPPEEYCPRDWRKPSGDGRPPPQRRPSHDTVIAPPPPPPPPAPPLLKELQHLATPPPPPPPPLQHMASGPPVVYGGQTSGLIEIVMDDDQPKQQPQPPPHPAGTPSNDTPAPIVSPPASPPSSSRNGHCRGRSSIDHTSHSLGARISRATERMRSASRNRTWDNVMRTKSPDAPYESVPAPPSFQARPLNGVPAPGQVPLGPQGEWRTGLLRSEMI